MAHREDLVIPSIAVADPEERARIDDLVAPELEWYANQPSYSTNSQIVSAWIYRRADIVHVGVDQNIAPIKRLRNPDRIGEFPPLLRRHAALALRTFGILWREELQHRGIDDPDLRLSVTSLARSEETQTALAEDPKKLAAVRSTHTQLGAFDIDTSGYYVVDRALGLSSAVHPDRPEAEMRRIDEKLELGDTRPVHTPKATQPFMPEVVLAANDIASKLHAHGLVNRILEYAGTPNQCLHISPNPNQSEWLRAE